MEILIAALATVLLVGLPIAYFGGRAVRAQRNANAQNNPGGGTTTPPPGGNTAPPQTPNATPAATPSAAPASHHFWNALWFNVIMGLLVLVIAGVLVLKGMEWMEFSTPNWDNEQYMLYVVGAIAGALFIAGLVLISIGKKGGALVMIAGLAVFFGWLGVESVKIARDDLLAVGNVRVASSPNCPREQTVVIEPGERFTYHRPESCGSRLALRWEPPISAHLKVRVNGNLGSAGYTQLPFIQPEFAYRGTIETATFLNLDSEPTDVVFFYQ